MNYTVNPAAETIAVAGLKIQFLVTGEQSNGTAASFEMVVPGGQARGCVALVMDRDSSFRTKLFLSQSCDP